jgi:hypothetical protein
VEDEVGILLLGDFNRSHSLWKEERNLRLCTTVNLTAAHTLLDFLVAYNMKMLLAKGVPTLEARNKKLDTP